LILWVANRLVHPRARSRRIGAAVARFDEVHEVDVEALAAYHQSLANGVSPETCLPTLLRALVADGVLLPEALDELSVPVPETLRKTLEGVILAWDTARGIPAIGDLVGIVGRSGRQLARNLSMLARAARYESERWRTASLRLRLRAAAFMLSAPNVSVGDVAEEVGYGSVQALNRALRDARFPCATDVRAALLEARADFIARARRQVSGWPEALRVGPMQQAS
jgi:AraC-like DNA-binding protein